MARKGSAADPKPASSTALPKKKSATPKTPGTLKRKIDWATIDEGKDFSGFTLKAVTLRTVKKSTRSPKKKQKLDAQANRVADNYKDAPLDAEVFQKNPFPETELSEIHCKVEPALEWESTLRYRKFTILTRAPNRTLVEQPRLAAEYLADVYTLVTGEEFEVGQIVFVKKTAEDHDTPDAIEQWFAKVLEVRAGDAAHVYLRVYWAYRPEDLPGGRQPHHGESELIVSNHMDIIEALTVESIADVAHWDDDPNKVPGPDQLFWRQSLDITKPKSKPQPKLKTYCLDHAPFNPDEPLIHCPSCAGWLHAHCLEEQAVQDAIKTYNVLSPQAPKAKGRSKKEAKQGEEESSTATAFSAELSITDSGNTRLTVIDKRKGQKNRQWNVDVSCLLCQKLIAKAEKDESQESAPKMPMGNVDDEDGITVATTSSKAKSKFAEDDDDVKIKDAPTSDTVKPEPESATSTPTTAPRGRERPVGSSKKRKRASTAATTAIITAAHTVTTPTTTTATSSSVVPEVTPTPVQVSESVFQSGVRSVKRLLWRAT